MTWLDPPDDTGPPCIRCGALDSGDPCDECLYVEDEAERLAVLIADEPETNVYD